MNKRKYYEGYRKNLSDKIYMMMNRKRYTSLLETL